SPYAGLAYEYEFDGKSKASTNGYKIDRPDMKGGTGVFEGGLIVKPTPNHPLSVNVGLQGYTGKMQGWGGSVRVKYEF
ncbi:MAG: autotransporter outer membrane beta-barrel domain-containing protein, partial [Betaproteobacteria bacterium]|nr:autotransporter outer membrane beta-barrel domain-containing protein [Betaproteobacteria bacterium]